MKAKLRILRTKAAVAVGLIAISIVVVWGLTPKEADAQMRQIPRVKGPTHMTGPMTINAGEGYRVGLAHQPGGSSTGQSRRRGTVIVEDLRNTALFEIPVDAHFDSFFDIDYQIDAATGVGTMSTYDQQGRVISQSRVASGVVKITVYSGTDGKGRDVPIELVSLQAYDENGSMKGNAETTWKVEKGEK